jgi:hypothetical protein
MDHGGAADTNGLSRADLLKRVGITGAGAAALGTVPGLSAQAAAAPTARRDLYRIYLSESTDGVWCVFSALLMPQSHFKTAVKRARVFRAHLQKTYSIRTSRDIKAMALIGNHTHFASRAVTDAEIVAIYTSSLRFITKNPGTKLWLTQFTSPERRQALAQLLARINAFLRESNGYAVLIDHERNAPSHLALLRGRLFFPAVPSSLDPWFGTESRRKPDFDRIISNPRMHAGKHVQFAQFSNYASFAFLRHLEPSARVKSLGLTNAVDILRPILAEVVRGRGVG